MKANITFFFLLSIFSQMKTQVGIGTSSPDPGTVLDLVSTNTGLLIPRVSLQETTDMSTVPVSADDEGIIVYNINDAGTVPKNVTKNTFYIWVQNEWQAIGEVPEIRNEITANNTTLQVFSGQLSSEVNFTTTNTYSPWTPISYSTEYYDGSNIHSAGIFTIPETGLYSFSLSAYVSTNLRRAAGIRIMNITNNTELVTSYLSTNRDPNSLNPLLNVPLYWTGQLTAGTQLQIQLRTFLTTNPFNQKPLFTSYILINKHL
ncbi:hypothetical protein [Chryseobacterium sp. JM1]|uniref:hypothetical protein n=1 Tax=Chryseobacterium sp. JM1 TaxID=1233950 RepID=UPI0004E77FEE|nr:hypothetical protein [Chryseobacterium sp. JM1]KFF20103.1 hypothetical protein IW22_14390 [Chryseobacterium sp. JM1]